MTNGSAEPEEIRHQHKIQEIILDKLILALIVLLAGFGLNQRLSRYENALDSQLEKLKAAYNLDRILYQREIEAHENTWKALIDFRQATRSHFGHRFDPERNEAMLAAAATLVSVTEFESLYLTQEAKDETKKLYVESFPEFRRRWREDDKDSVMSKRTWNWWAGNVDAVGEVFSELIQAKRTNALRSEISGQAAEAARGIHAARDSS